MTARIARGTSRVLAALARLLGIRGRVCARCRRWKVASAFRANAKMRDGLHSWCSSCMVDRGREWRLAHPVHFATYNESRRVAHAPRVCPGCEETFTPGRVDAVYCSERCRRRAENLRSSARSRIAVRASRPCSECRETFTPSRSSRQIFCSRRCAHRADKRRTAARRRDAA